VEPLSFVACNPFCVPIKLGLVVLYQRWGMRSLRLKEQSMPRCVNINTTRPRRVLRINLNVILFKDGAQVVDNVNLLSALLVME